MFASPVPWQSQLAAGTVRTIDAAPIARYLRLEQGRLWLTRVRADADDFRDHWLLPGDVIALPPGSAWLAEAQHDGLYLLLEAEPVCPRAPGWWQALRGELRAWFRTASSASAGPA